MIPWLLDKIGISQDMTSRLDRVEWAFARPLWLWVGLVLLVPLAAFVILRQRRNLPHVNFWPRAVMNAWWPMRMSRTRSGVASIAWYWRSHLIAESTGQLDSNVASCIAVAAMRPGATNSR